jgi:hypothetical protein
MKRTWPLVAAVWSSMMAGYGQTTIDVRQGGTGAGDAATARGNLGAAATIHTHNLTDLNGITGKAGGGSLLQTFGGGTVNTNDCAKFDASGNVISAGGPCGSGGSGGSGSSPLLTPVTFSATPAFPITNTTQGFTFTLTGAVTSSTFSGSPSDGQEVWFRICQDSAGGHAFAYPSSVTGADAVDTAVNACTAQLFKYIAVSTTYAAITTGKSDNTSPGLTTAAGTLNLPAPAGGATLTQTIASGAAALGTSAIASQSCASVVTVSAPGTASTDVIIVTPNSSLKGVSGFTAAATGGLTVSWYPTTNSVNIDVCNWASNSITPGAVTLNWRVVR